MIETRYPAVYLTEISTGLRSIGGVSTSTATADASAQLATANTPDWTDHNESDPGITLTQFFAWLTESLVYRADPIPLRFTHRFLRDSPDDCNHVCSTAISRKP